MNAAAKLIRPETTALVVVDLQERLMPAIEGADAVIANVHKLLEAAKILGLETFLTTQYEKGLGPTVPQIAAASPVEAIDKVCFGCFGDDGFRETLAKRAPAGAALLLAGVEAHICVCQTALGALADGYDVHVVADAVGSRTVANKSLGLDRMRQAGGIISSTEMAIYELLGNARRDEFKRMLPYLK